VHYIRIIQSRSRRESEGQERKGRLRYGIRVIGDDHDDSKNPLGNTSLTRSWS